MLCILLAIVIGVFLAAEKDNQQVQDWGKWTFILPAILALFTMIRHMRNRMVRITVSDDRVREEVGFLSKSTRTIELDKIQEVNVRRTMWQRLWGVGDLSMETAGRSSQLAIHSIDHPQQAADRILEAARALRSRPDTGTHPGV
ncbi:MAG TPA: PH domain-containing protein [Bryobacteraceae bacterium]|nr:PH domain-containing protein [Bryobacteraceae bacterium]